jgi:hypothetical protein
MAPTGAGQDPRTPQAGNPAGPPIGECLVRGGMNCYREAMRTQTALQAAVERDSTIEPHNGGRENDALIGSRTTSESDILTVLERQIVCTAGGGAAGSKQGRCTLVVWPSGACSRLDRGAVKWAAHSVGDRGGQRTGRESWSVGLLVAQAKGG